MKTIVLLTSLFFSLIAVHDVPIAYFKMYSEQSEFVLEINFDRMDLCKAIGVDSSQLNKGMLQEYIDMHTCFEFDSNSSTVHIKNMQLDGEHLKVKGVFDNMPEKFKSLSIENSCLLSIKGHSNIVKIESGNTFSDFHMHKGRTKINIEL